MENTVVKILVIRDLVMIVSRCSTKVMNEPSLKTKRKLSKVYIPMLYLTDFQG